MTKQMLRKKYILPTLLLSLFSGSSYAGIVYFEGFTGQNNKGVNGGSLNDFDGVSWSVDITNANLTARDDYVKVVPHPAVPGDNDYLEARDVGGPENNKYAQWFSPVIDLVGGSGFSFSLDTFVTRGAFEGDEYVEIFYLADGGPATSVQKLMGDFADTTVSSAIADGFLTLQIMAEFSNGDENGEQYGIDNIELIADVVPPSVPEPTILALLGFGLAGIGYRRKKI